MRIDFKMKRPGPHNVSLEAARGKLAMYVAAHKLKSTMQRDRILEIFFSVPGHHGIDDLVKLAKIHGRSIGPATVYRTMKLLTDAGIATARHFEGGQTKYEAAFDRHHHDHMI